MSLKEDLIMETIRQRFQHPQHILPTYVTTENTFTIIPVNHIDFSSIVVEKNAVYGVQQTPLQIIDYSCNKDWTTYEGRRQYIIKETEFSYKTPILTHREGIHIGFPTKSAHQDDCIWIFPKNIMSVKGHGQHSSVTFSNGFELFLNISLHSLNIQLQRSNDIHRLIVLDHPNDK